MTAVDPSDATIDLVAALLKTVVGLRPESTLRARLRRCIRDESFALGLSPEAYYRELTSREQLRQGLLNRITVQETSFFRHPDQFDVLAREIFASLTPPLTIWSAGCANGQEAYSLAMVLEEQGVPGTVIATDVSTQALARTQAAQYSAREIAGLAPERMLRHLTHVGQHWEIKQRLRDRVVVLHHNLLDPIPPRVRGSQVVFCRNVLIYFSVTHGQEFLNRVAQALPEAWVMLGAAETMSLIGDGYDTLHFGNSYVYRRSAGGDRPGPAAALSPAGAVSPAGAPEPVRAPRAFAPAPVRDPPPDEVARLSRAGQAALTAGDQKGAVVIFRKWAYLAPRDALAHLHLGLALEALGDRPSAQRAFGAARRALEGAEYGELEFAMQGFAPAELHKLLDAKRQEPIR